jgi:hypothetical protein
MILYQGPSLLDGAPIVVIATISKQAARANVKTGNMLQTWILRQDMPPAEAAKAGADASVCGSCALRGDGKDRPCYVVLWQAPRSVHDAYTRGIYPTAASPDEIAAVGAGLDVRLGSYGDPAAVPLWVWEALVSRARKRTGYTHQWRGAATDPGLRRLVMASCDKPADREAATAAGWRTFRVRAEEQPLLPGEITCPASKEAGKRTTCAACGLCGGAETRAKDIAIIAHGPRAAIAAALARG